MQFNLKVWLKTERMVMTGGRFYFSIEFYFTKIKNKMKRQYLPTHILFKFVFLINSNNILKASVSKYTINIISLIKIEFYLYGISKKLSINFN